MTQRIRLTPDAQARLAGTLLHAYLAGRTIPPYIPLEANRMAAALAAARQAPEFLETLANVYGVRHWTYPAFRRVVVLGAMASWRPGTIVNDRPDGLDVVSPTCPLGAEVERDARACQYCRAFQEQVARSAFGSRVASVEFSSLISRGDGACRQELRLRPAQAA